MFKSTLTGVQTDLLPFMLSSSLGQTRAACWSVNLTSAPSLIDVSLVWCSGSPDIIQVPTVTMSPSRTS